MCTFWSFGRKNETEARIKRHSFKCHARVRIGMIVCGWLFSCISRSQAWRLCFIHHCNALLIVAISFHHALNILNDSNSQKSGFLFKFWKNFMNMKGRWFPDLTVSSSYALTSYNPNYHLHREWCKQFWQFRNPENIREKLHVVDRF